MKATITPSKDWTDRERLQLIQEHVADAMKRRLILMPAVTADVMDKINLISSQSATILEANREEIIRFPD